MVSTVTGDNGREKAEVAAPPSLQIRLLKYVPTLVLAAVAVYILLPQWATLENSVQVIRRMSVLAVAAAAVAQVLSYAGNGYLLLSLVASVGDRLRLARSMAIVVASSSIGLVAGGVVGNAAATYRLMRLRGVSQQGAVLAGWFPTLFNNAILLVLGLVGLVELLVRHDLSRPVAISFGVVAALMGGFAALVVWGIYHRSGLSRIAERLSRRWAALRRRAYDPAATRASLQRIFQAWDLSRAGKWRGPVAGAALNILFDLLTLYLLFIAAGHRVDPGLLLAGYGLPLLLGKVTFLPGGIGVVEGGMAAIYTALGVPHALTVVVIIAYRVLSFWLPSLIGFPLFAYMVHFKPAEPDTPKP